jgi:hypothetical protein
MQSPYRKASKFVLCAVLCSTPAWAGPSPVADLQTLFYTPAERHAITLRRSGQEGAAAVTATRLTGVVRRGGGKGTVWVNGKPYAEGSRDTGAIKGVDAMVDGRRLRVGEGIDTATGARVDIVAPGAVTPGRKP